MKIFQRYGTPSFTDLPWNVPLSEWGEASSRIVNMQRGVSRHPVQFANYDGVLYVFKELPIGVAEKEYDRLSTMEKLRLPAVIPVAYLHRPEHSSSMLVTRFLDWSIPYRLLFKQGAIHRYNEFLLDAIAGLLVQMHLAGVYWGDCSLSNTLFRRDAGALRAYLVDAETAEIYPDFFPAERRYDDLEIMCENVDGEIDDLAASEELPYKFWHQSMGAYIKVRYQNLWEEITREDIVNFDESYRIQERIKALNTLGFSVGGVELAETESGNQLRLNIMVTDRNFHHDQLHNLIGLDVEEMQARKMMNEIQELKATLSRENNRSTPLSVAANRWLETVYLPAVNRLQVMTDNHLSLPEIYCQLLEHKWYLSERMRHDVGHQAAIDDYLKCFNTSEGTP